MNNIRLESLTCVERTTLALNCLYNNLVEMQTLIGERKIDLFDNAFIKEFCTIKLTTSRRSGHSTAIGNFVANRDGTWIVLTHNLHQARYLMNTIADAFVRSNVKILKQTQSEIISQNNAVILSSYNCLDGMRGRRVSGVICDCASLLKKKQIKEMVKILCPAMRLSKSPCFIYVE